MRLKFDAADAPPPADVRLLLICASDRIAHLSPALDERLILTANGPLSWPEAKLTIQANEAMMATGFISG